MELSARISCTTTAANCLPASSVPVAGLAGFFGAVSSLKRKQDEGARKKVGSRFVTRPPRAGWHGWVPLSIQKGCLASVPGDWDQASDDMPSPSLLASDITSTHRREYGISCAHVCCPPRLTLSTLLLSKDDDDDGNPLQNPPLFSELVRMLITCIPF